jgi:ketosteroid isomerase-like protein
MNSEVAEKFVDRINAHDVDGLVTLMSDDHVFIDSLGGKFSGPEIETGWRQYFADVPDYWIRIDRVVADESALILFGTAGGTYVADGGIVKPENRWETPAVWRAVIQDGRVSEWRIFADNEPIRVIMRAMSHQLASVPRESQDNMTVGESEGPAPNATQEIVHWKKLEEEVKKKLEGITPQMAEERYNYLSRKPISELTDDEYEERLALAKKLSERADKKNKTKTGGR